MSYPSIKTKGRGDRLLSGNTLLSLCGLVVSTAKVPAGMHGDGFMLYSSLNLVASGRLALCLSSLAPPLASVFAIRSRVTTSLIGTALVRQQEEHIPPRPVGDNGRNRFERRWMITIPI